MEKITKEKKMKNMNTKKELGKKYANLRSDIRSYTNDNYDAFNLIILLLSIFYKLMSQLKF
jgi:hypothetical protein